MKLVVSLLLLALTHTGCSVYQNGDRKDFNSNGASRAPSHTLALEDVQLLENPCAAFRAVAPEDMQLIFSQPHLSMLNQITPRASTCFVQAPDADANSISILSCSWKPVDGSPVPDANDNIIATTEDDMHSYGYDVALTKTVSGARLRMNCEGYVPTQALINDRRSGERATDGLAPRFAVFARQLKRATLSDAQTSD